MQSLKPRVDLIKARYGDDKDAVTKETSKLYEQAGVNPLAGARTHTRNQLGAAFPGHRGRTLRHGRALWGQQSVGGGGAVS